MSIECSYLLIYLSAELPQEILPLLASPEDLLSVGGKFRHAVKNCAQVFVLLHKLSIPPVDCADDSCSQLPLLAE